MERFKLTGDIEWYLASGDADCKEKVEHSMDHLVNDDGSLNEVLPAEDLLALVYWMRETKVPKYELAVRETAKNMQLSIPGMPFFTAYDTEYSKKEHYSDIVRQFYDLKALTPDELVILTDTIGQMSEEIYEHYRALIELLRKHLRTAMTAGHAEEEELMKIGYSALKAFNLGILKHETYYEFGTKIWKSTADSGNDRYMGMKNKFRAQYLRSGK